MEIKKEDLVRFRTYEGREFYALPAKFFNKVKYEDIEIIVEAEELISKKQKERADRELELAEKKRVAEEALIK